MILPVRFVCATRYTRDQFINESALAKSLKAQQQQGGYELQVFFENTLGLSKVYNMAIEQSINRPAILVFVHDDVHITDHFWLQRIHDGLAVFDVIGVAGNVRMIPGQPSWAFVSSDLTWDATENLSGVVGHGKQYPFRVSRYGASGQACQLVDGVFLACQSRFLLDRELRFDLQFDFHFYDLDFSRQVVLKGGKLGTWPLSIVHESGGNFRSPAWKLAYQKYLEKYEEPRR